MKSQSYRSKRTGISNSRESNRGVKCDGTLTLRKCENYGNAKTIDHPFELLTKTPGTLN